ncbi:hypothetical protein LAZ40_04415 [Cereibacter sphaeroides]|uniref:hypothetical protein n=1 Tax=Cereibacter sphaeroides TaxID=1063 RepID=UPI001F274FDB|nr:hypothetical protein [Cereibacter sphaeroides]MCE6958299.1 hypothetical protein [Cereibacter sphaeroides]MCE6971909.1 hypothetical protein [Cereibacter sphaeroides]
MFYVLLKVGLFGLLLVPPVLFLLDDTFAARSAEFGRITWRNVSERVQEVAHSRLRSESAYQVK